MASFREFTATSALNQDNYVNKLYDKRQQTQKDLMDQSQKDSTDFLSGQSQSVQNQTKDYVNRTNVESQAAAQSPSYPRQNLSAAASAQQGLSRGNANQANTGALNAQQAQAEAEIQRQRQNLAQYYQQEIQRATAENDMQRAQALYNAAKNEESRLESLRKEAALYAQSHGDNSVLDSMVAGEPVQRDTATPTSAEVLKDEPALNKIYDANYQAQQASLRQDLDQKLSDLEAQQAQTRLKTDRDLNAAYTSALMAARNAAERQNASGMGSGTAAQAGLARELGLQQDMTNLRKLQLEKDAQAGMKAYGVNDAYRKALEKANAENELKRAQALYKAAEDNEVSLIDQQKWLGNLLAQQGDDSVLHKLYGFTPEQLARMFPPASGGGGPEPTGIPAIDFGVSKEWADKQNQQNKNNSDGSTSDGTTGPIKGTLELGYGPISPGTLADKVASGAVKVNTDSNGNIQSVSKAPSFTSAATHGGTVFVNPIATKTNKRR